MAQPQILSDDDVWGASANTNNAPAPKMMSDDDIWGKPEPSAWDQIKEIPNKIADFENKSLASTGRVLSAAAQGAKEGFAPEEPLGFDPDYYQKHGFGDDPKSVGDFIKQLPAQMLSGGAGIADLLVNRIPGAVINAGVEGVVQAAKENGMDDSGAERLGRDINGFIQSEMGRSGEHAAAQNTAAAIAEKNPYNPSAGLFNPDAVQEPIAGHLTGPTPEAEQANQNLKQIAQGKPATPPVPELAAPRAIPDEFVSDGQGGVRPITETEKWQTSPTDILVSDNQGGIRPMTQQEVADRTALMQQMLETGNTPDVRAATNQRFNPVSQPPEPVQATPKQPLSLPEPQKSGEIATDSAGVSRETTQSDAFAAQQERERLKNLGITPDIARVIANLNKPTQDAGTQALEAIAFDNPKGLIGASPKTLDTAASNKKDMLETPQVIKNNEIYTKNVNTSPSEAQKEAGNYKKAHATIQGLPVTIENPAGSVRNGTDAAGNPWSVTMPVDYGYIKKTEGADGDHLDAYIGPNKDAPNVYVVDQKDPQTGDFDEHKAMIGFNSPAKARAAYEGAFSDGSGKDRAGAVTAMPIAKFKSWLKNGDTTKPLSYEKPKSVPQKINKAAKPAEISPDTKIIQDAGEKIGGARKDQWAGRGLTTEDLHRMTGGEAAEYVKKDAVWPKPDYAKLIESGMEPEAAALLKIMRDKLAAAPRYDTPEGREHYVEAMSKFKELAEQVKTPTDVRNLRNDFGKSLGFDGGTLAAAELRRKYFSILKGGNDGALRVSYEDARRAQRLLLDGFPANREAWQTKYSISEQPDYINGDTKWVLRDKKTFRTIQESKDKNELIETAKNMYEENKPKAGDKKTPPLRPHLDKIRRTGKDLRNGKDADSKDFVKDFGFRGVEFGNWVAGDERQKSVNHAYDALMDLAHTLNIPPEALSLNGKMGLAFGARGAGKAAAHYESSKLVINLTKISGAGTLAHEWGHALDHYFGELDRQDAYQGKARGASGWYEKENYDRGEHRLPNLRPEVRDAFNGVMSALFGRDMEKAEYIRDLEQMRENFQNKARIQKERIDEHIKRVPDKMKQDRKFLKAAAEFIDNMNRRVKNADHQLEEARKADAPQPNRKVDTNYFGNAKAISGEKGYWARPTEMFARAFEGYVQDKIAEQGNKSQYLVHSTEGEVYPSGKERANINAAFDKLFQTLKTREGSSGKQSLYEGTGSNNTAEFSSNHSDFVDFTKGRVLASPQDTHKAIRDYILDRGKETGQEHAVLLNAKTGKVIDVGSSGLEDNINWDDRTAQLLNDPKNLIDLHHNHPNGTVLSPQDLRVLSMRGTHSVTAYAPNGDVSYASLTPYAKSFLSGVENASKIENILENAEQGVRDVLQKAVNDGTIDFDEAEKIGHDLALRGLHQAGIIDYVSSHKLTDNDSVLRMAINKGAEEASWLAKLLKGEGNEFKTSEGSSARRADDALSRFSKESGLSEISRRAFGKTKGNEESGEIRTLGGEGYSASPTRTRKSEGLAQFKPGESLKDDHTFGEKLGNALQKAEATVKEKVSGTPLERFAHYYRDLLQPETVSEKSKLGDALLAQHMVAKQNLKSSIAMVMQHVIERWDAAPLAAQKEWIKNYEEGKRNHPYDDFHKSMMDATLKAENEAFGRNPEDYYRDNYVSHIFESPDKVQRWIESQIKRYGQDWFTKKRAFDLVEEAEKAGFKLRTYNPAELDQMRLNAGADMILHQKLLNRMAESGLAAKVKKTVAEGKTTFDIEQHPKVTQADYDSLKYNHFTVKGPDNKDWWVHDDMEPVWKNAMEKGGLQQADSFAGDAYRFLQSVRNIQLPVELGFSLFHPFHVYTIHWATGIASAIEHVAKAPSFEEGFKGALEAMSMPLKAGLGKEGVNPLRALYETNKGKRLQSIDSPLVSVLKIPDAQRTPEQKAIVQRYEDGGFTPTMSERDKIHFRRAMMKAINTKQFHKAILPAALAPFRAVTTPFMEHWIPALKAQAYMMRTLLAERRDPELATNKDKRAIVFRQIAKDLDRTYGEMNYDTLFWNKSFKDVAKVSFISMGWKLAQLYYYMGKPAIEIPKLIYNWARTGKAGLNKEGLNTLRNGVTYQSTMSVSYWAVALLAGSIATYMMTGHEPRNYLDMNFPPTGEKSADGSEDRLSLPFFNKEGPSWKYHVDQEGLLKGSVSFITDMSTLPGIWHFLNNEDHFGNPLVSQFNWDQLSHMAISEIKPISMNLYDRAQLKKSDTAAMLSFFGAGLAPNYVGKTTFENKVAGAYFKEKGSHGSVYQRDLENEYKLASQSGDTEKMDSVREKLIATGMKPKEINTLGRAHTTDFTEYAWKGFPNSKWQGLSAETQIELYQSANDAEKKKFYPMMKPEARSQVERPQ